MVEGVDWSNLLPPSSFLLPRHFLRQLAQRGRDGEGRAAHRGRPQGEGLPAADEAGRRPRGQRQSDARQGPLLARLCQRQDQPPADGRVLLQHRPQGRSRRRPRHLRQGRQPPGQPHGPQGRLRERSQARHARRAEAGGTAMRHHQRLREPAHLHRLLSGWSRHYRRCRGRRLRQGLREAPRQREEEPHGRGLQERLRRTHQHRLRL